MFAGCPCLRIIDCLGGFRRHVVFIMLGQYFGGDKSAVGFQFALCNSAFAFLEQIGKDTFVMHRDTLLGIGDGK